METWGLLGQASGRAAVWTPYACLLYRYMVTWKEGWFDFFFFFGFLAFCSLLLALRMEQSRTLPGGETSVLS